MTFNLDETNCVFLHTCRTNKVHKVIKKIAKGVDKSKYLKTKEIKEIGKKLAKSSYGYL